MAHCFVQPLGKVGRILGGGRAVHRGLFLTAGQASRTQRRALLGGLVSELQRVSGLADSVPAGGAEEACNNDNKQH